MPEFYSEWFSTAVGKPVIVCRVPRNILDAYRPKEGEKDESKDFSNNELESMKNKRVPGIHIMNIATVDEIRRMMEEKYPVMPDDLYIHWEQYKANILVDMKEPWIEDYISEMRLGNLWMRFARPCFRCRLIYYNIHLCR
jgi:uncharacterized protein YcbX